MSHAGWIPPKIRAVLHSRPSGVAHEVLLYWIPLSSLKFLQTQDLKKEPFTWRALKEKKGLFASMFCIVHMGTDASER